jgi:UDP-N-acetylglucosamine diphosphorylase/glucosamine-1-phosphate N-acetyltransferase
MSLQFLRILHDPAMARTWSPFAETGAVGRLLFGTLTLEARLSRWSGLPLSSTENSEGPGGTLWLSPRFLPGDARLPEAIRRWQPDDGIRKLTLPDGRALGWLTPPGRVPNWVPRGRGREAPGGEGATGATDRESGGPEIPIEGALLESPWALMQRNPQQIAEDLDRLVRAGNLEALGVRRVTPGPLPGGGWVVGDAPVTLEADAVCGPHTVLDASGGPIHLGRGVQIAPFTHLCGPAWIGPEARLLGGRLSEVTVGPVSRVRGEVEASILQGWTNKAHDGFLGHAVVGSWVNLGALTTNSDLKNTYGTVRVPLGPDVEEDTGMQKVGVLLGDHVKTGIGTLLGTGSVVGTGSNLLASGQVTPRWIAPFSWLTEDGAVPVRWEAFLTIARRSMARRSKELEPDEEASLRALWVRTHGRLEGPNS